MNFMFSWQEQYLLPLEHKIHIFSPPCNILYLSHVLLLGIEFLSVAYVLTVFCCDNWYVCFYPTWCCWVSSFTVLLTCLHFSTVTIDVFTFVPRDFSWPSSVAEIWEQIQIRHPYTVFTNGRHAGKSEALKDKQKLQMKTFSELAECLALIPLKITLYGRLFKYNYVGCL